jgi:hypothetical protein
VAAHEDQVEQVILDDAALDQRLALRRPPLQLMGELLVAAGPALVLTDHVDRPVLGGAHQPRARVVRHALGGPLLERGDQGVLGEILGQAHVPHDPGQTRDEPARLDAPDRVDGPVGVGHAWCRLVRGAGLAHRLDPTTRALGERWVHPRGCTHIRGPSEAQPC